MDKSTGAPCCAIRQSHNKNMGGGVSPGDCAR